MRLRAGFGSILTTEHRVFTSECPDPKNLMGTREEELSAIDSCMSGTSLLDTSCHICVYLVAYFAAGDSFPPSTAGWLSARVVVP